MLVQLFYHALLVGVELYLGSEVFPPNFKMKRSKQNDEVEVWKFSFKIGAC